VGGGPGGFIQSTSSRWTLGATARHSVGSEIRSYAVVCDMSSTMRRRILACRKQ
jgi:hypothetical protein